MEKRSKMNGFGFYSYETMSNGKVIEECEPGIVFTDEKAQAIERVKRMLTTRPTERVCNPEYGSLLYQKLFESERSIPDIFDEIERCIDNLNKEGKNSPKIELVDCSLIRYAEDTLDVNLVLRLEDSPLNDTFEANVTMA